METHTTIPPNPRSPLPTTSSPVALSAWLGALLLSALSSTICSGAEPGQALPAPRPLTAIESPRETDGRSVAGPAFGVTIPGQQRSSGWRTLRRGAIAYTVPESMLASPEELLVRVDLEFQAALREITALLAHSPREVKVLVDPYTQRQQPGSYNARFDTITVSARWFNHDRPSPEFQLSRDQLRQLTSHVVRHELAHLVLAHKVGLEEYQRGESAVPLWILEGFAEWASGGAKNACRSGREVKAFFQNGVFDGRELERAMLMTGTYKDPASNHKAYVQAYFMAKYLIERFPNPKEGVAAFFDLVGQLVRSRTSLAEALARHGLTVEQFVRGWRTLIDRDVLEPDEPLLARTNF